MGQQFAQKYFCGVMLSVSLALFLLFATPGAFPELVVGNSDTPEKAFRRYVSTVRRVRTWYSGDPWGAEGKEARRQLAAVRRMHASVRSRLRGAAPDDAASSRPQHRALGTAHAVREDFAPFAKDANKTLCAYLCAISLRHEWLNQLEMALTQWSFMGLAVTYPARFGLGGASEEQLDAFVHLWRALAHLLGVEERFNFCAGGLRAVRRRSRALLRRCLAPALAHVNADWEHMTRCAVESSNMYAPPIDYEVTLLYLCETLGYATPRLRQSLSTRQLRDHRLLGWALRWAMLVAPLRAFANRRLHRAIDATRQPPEEKKEVDEAQRPPGPPLLLYSTVFFFVVAAQVAVIAFALLHNWGD